MNRLDAYIDWMRERLGDISNLAFAIDCSNGMASLLVRKIFPNAMVINDVLDGHFRCHSPNPLLAEARAELSKLVVDKKLDCGVIFDGDADRAMLVDEYGQFVQPDYLIPIVAKATGIGKVIHDVRTSRGAIEELKRMGCEPVMVPVGHAFAKPILREVGAICGGELAGHYYFKEFYGCDSGMLAAIRILGEIALAKRKGMSFSKMMQPITKVYANSGEINFTVENKDVAVGSALKVAKTFGSECSRNEMDGVRLDYNKGWINIRKSNTEPYLRLIVECDTNVRLIKWVQALEVAIKNAC